MSNLMRFMMVIISLALLLSLNANAFAVKRFEAKRKPPLARRHRIV